LSVVGGEKRFPTLARFAEMLPVRGKGKTIIPSARNKPTVPGLYLLKIIGAMSTRRLCNIMHANLALLNNGSFSTELLLVKEHVNEFYFKF
jgi:hypothetical protein